MPSLLRGFSAPVTVDAQLDDRDLAFLAAHDSDPFNRWEAGQKMAIARLMALTDAVEAGQPLALDEAFVDVVRSTLRGPGPVAVVQGAGADAAGRGLHRRAARRDRARGDPRRAPLHASRNWVAAWRRSGRRVYDALAVPGPYSPDHASAGKRGLRNLALAYLVDADVPGALELARAQLAAAEQHDRSAGRADAIVNSAAPLQGGRPGAAGARPGRANRC